MKWLFLFLVLTIFISKLYSQVTDIDGNTYKTVIIGQQEWMAENLKVEHYRNGDVILWVQDDKKWHNTIRDACCYSVLDVDNNVVDTGKFFGILYNWWAVDDQRGLAPEGWHMPSDNEWTILTDYLGGESVAGGKLKATILWNNPNKGATNESGFTALPAGVRFSPLGKFIMIGLFDNFWSSSEDSGNNAWFRGLFNDGSDVNRRSIGKELGYSCRCVKD